MPITVQLDTELHGTTESMGRKLTETVERILPDLEPIKIMPLTWTNRILQIPLRRLPAEEVNAAQRLIEEHPEPIWEDAARTNVAWDWVYAVSTLVCFRFPLHEYDRDGFASGYVAVNSPHYINPGDGHVISRLETHMRLFAFETYEFWKSHLSGFEDAYLLTIAPFLGSRGGPAIEGEYTMTEDDILQGRRFDDVIYLYARQGKWVDVPYRVMIPRKTDGLLAVGRSASARPASLLRSRIGLMQMGQAGGIAAALSTKNGVSPRRLDVKELQWKLLNAGCTLGDKTRLKELGLVG